ncbi:flagella synthesis protein FlgN [Dyella jiangningensis]|uniref:Flagellar biosynthesis protein FlgN n=1 Tax=Dyella jiangningensis TaxID=1379159 RepID=A0A328P4M8_9GAMM|nr:flagellar protein FlgN [Dyella jiangningensis]RAO77207.1 flagellar biosynthesis protein FlgN [Dyella jiangningensis]
MNTSLQAELDHALTAAVEEMRLAVEQLADALHEERTALETANVDALNHAGAAKHSLMLKLEQLDGERVQLSQGAPEAARELAPVWQQILQSLRACQMLNQRNGQLVGLRLQQVRKALAVLTGNDAEASVYGRAGELHTSLRSQTLAEA